MSTTKYEIHFSVDDELDVIIPDSVKLVEKTDKRKPVEMPDVRKLLFRAVPCTPSYAHLPEVTFSAEAYTEKGRGWDFENTSTLDDKVVNEVLERARTDIELAKKIKQLAE